MPAHVTVGKLQVRSFSYPFRNPFLAFFFPSLPLSLSPPSHGMRQPPLHLLFPPAPARLTYIRAAPSSSSWQTSVGGAAAELHPPLCPLSFYPFFCQHFTSTESAEHCRGRPFRSSPPPPRPRQPPQARNRDGGKMKSRGGLLRPNFCNVPHR